MRKPYFAARLSEQEASEAIAAIERAVTMLPDPDQPPPTLRDPRDDYLIALARAAGADSIVTGDGDLLEHEDLSPRAISPREACRQLEL